MTDATGGSVRVRITITAHDAPALWDLRCYVREAMLLWIQSEMPDAAPAQRILIGEASAPAHAEPARPKARAKKSPEPEHASDEGLFTGSLQAVERASVFLHREAPEAPEVDDGGVATMDLDAPIRD